MQLKVKAAFLYTENEMVASTNLEWLHTVFDMLMGLFDQVGLKTNVKKTVGMVCHPCWATRIRVYENNNRRMKRVRRIYEERQWERMNCPECGKYFTRGSLAVHRQINHSVAKGGPVQEGNRDGRGNKPMKNRMAFLDKSVKRPCPVEGYSGQAETQKATQMHFFHMHVCDTVLIL